MTRPVMHRLAFDPLERLLGRFEVNREPVGRNATAMAHLAGVGVRQIHRWRLDGISVSVADRVCTRVGHHVDELWDSIDEPTEAA